MIDYNYSPEALAKKRNEAATIYTKFTLLTSVHGKNAVYCFIEGYDMPYYRAIIRNVCRKEPVEIICNNKRSVIAANKFIEAKEDCKNYIKRYFVDRDFDNNDRLPNTIFVTDGYAIENYYLSDKCISSILETEFKISIAAHPEHHVKCMDLFHKEHDKFFNGTLLLNAWYKCLYHDPNWNRNDVSLDDKFPKEWLNLQIGSITHDYSLSDIKTKFNKAPILNEKAIEKHKKELKALGPALSRGKYEIQFLYEFLSYIKNEPAAKRVYSVAHCHLPFQLKTMISTFSQYAEVTDRLYKYIETGKR